MSGVSTAVANSPSTSAKLFDAHTHLHYRSLTPHLPRLLHEAAAAGVHAWVVCGTAPQDWEEVANLPRQPDLTDFDLRPAFGVHPWYVDNLPSDWLDHLSVLLQENPAATVGEVGLDRLRQSPDSATQVRILREQLRLAARFHRTVSLHAVRAVPQVLAEIRPFAADLPGFLVHSFAGSVETLRELIDLGGSVSFGGALLNPAARRVQAAAESVTSDRVLIETDAPDMLARGGLPAVPETRLNHPANLVLVMEQLAARQGWDTATAIARTTANAERLFPALS